MPFPTLEPSGRTYDAGDWPVRPYRALSGAEIRIRYGNRRSNAKLSLTYDNIADTSAESFLSHYYETEGTFKTFSVPASVYAGWAGNVSLLGPGSAGAAFRYAQPPQITASPCGKSSVTVELIGVT